MDTTKTPTPNAELQGAAQDHDEQVKMLQVFTTPQKPAEREEVVSANARNGKNEDGTKREVLECNRHRCIVIPELSIEGVPSKYHSICIGAIRAIAKKQLETIWEESPAVKEVQAALWSVDSLLLFAARETESKRLTKDNLGKWFDASDLCKRLASKNNAPLLQEWRDRIISFAATLSGVSKEYEGVIAAVSKADADEDNLVGRQIVAKAQARVDALAKAAEANFEAV